MIKNLPSVWETWVWSLGWEDPLEKGMATHSSILAWRIPWTEEPGRLPSMRLQRVGYDWVTFAFFHTKKKKNLWSHLNTIKWVHSGSSVNTSWRNDQLFIQLGRKCLSWFSLFNSTSLSCFPTSSINLYFKFHLFISLAYLCSREWIMYNQYLKIFLCVPEELKIVRDLSLICCMN